MATEGRSEEKTTATATTTATAATNATDISSKTSLAVIEESAFGLPLINLIYGYIRFIVIIVHNFYHIPIYLVINWILLLPVYLYKSSLYWSIENHLYSWLLYTVSSWSWAGGIKVIECNEDVAKISTTAETMSGMKYEFCRASSEINGNLNGPIRRNSVKSRKPTKVLVLSNHQSTADVPLMMAAFCLHPKFVLMWIMDSHFKWTNFGVCSLTHGDYFIKVKDYVKSELTKYCLSQKRTNCVILFPEGGFRYKRKESSNHYAVKSGLPVLETLTWPRVGAFNDLIDESLEFTHVIDVTIMYPELDNPLSIIDIALGLFPRDVYFYYRIYDLSKITVDENWLNQIWLEKERIMKHYYESKEDFLKQVKIVRTVELSWPKVLVVHLFYILATLCFLFLFKLALSFIY